jgi:5-methylcytosine-specific restriction endonuclease McrA
MRSRRDFYLTLRWRFKRWQVLSLYGRRCMQCGSTRHIEVDHIIARARGWFGEAHQWKFRNLQVLCHAHNQEKGVQFADWRPRWARLVFPVHDVPSGRSFRGH